MNMMNQTHQTGTANPIYMHLFRIGGAAALIAAVIFRRNLDAEFMLLRGSGIINIGPTVPPSTVIDWFALLQSHPLLGLTLMNLFDLVNYALVGLIFLALFASLRRTSESFMTIAVLLGLTGITTYFASNQAFTMLSLSNQYTAAVSDVQRAMFLAAGQAVLAIHQNNSFTGMGIYVSFLLVSLSGLIISMVMLQSKVFGKGISYMGILANSLGLGYYIFLLFAPALVFLPLSVSAIFLLIWYILISRRLFQLSKIS